VPKVTKNRLARGTKLTPEHIGATIDTTASPRVGYQINQGTFDRDNVEGVFSPFRVHFSVPFIDSTYRRDGGGAQETRAYAIPFMLPPLQDTFSLTAVNGRLFPNASGASLPLPVVLDELSISMDQRAESAAIVDSYQGSTLGQSTVQGDMNFDAQPKLNMRVGISQKMPIRFGASVPFATEDMETVEMFSAEVTYPNWLADGPYVMRGLSKVIDPYQTYVLTVEFPDLTGENIAIVNMNISLRLTHELVSRDLGANIQNLPNKGDARQTRAVVDAATGITTSVTITNPTAGSTIDADTTDGVSYNLGTIDEALAEKLTGGRDKYGEVGPTEELAVDAGYEVIAVPLFGNRRRGGIAAQEVALEPYVVHGDATLNYLADRRIIPIVHPLTVHHVFLAYNWQLWNNVYLNNTGVVTTGGAVSLPESKFFKVEVGVGMATGLQGDHFNYDQIAYAAMQNPYAEGGSVLDPWRSSDGGTWPLNLVDIVKSSATTSGVRNFSTVSTAATSDPKRFWDFDLMQIPLVGAGGTGYVNQGHPVYVGRSWTPTAVDVTSTYNNDRQNIAGAAPNCEGQEQWLEVRMKISDNLAGGATSVALSGGGGSGYSDATNVATSLGTGTGLTVDITTAAGAITAATINQSGQGYTDGDIVRVATGTSGDLAVTVQAGLETTTDGGALGVDDYISGYGGHWVYLICKKNLT
jgi:hypothetical protein